ncbi:OmpP1/FadL family transporter [Litoribrevibacter euphylliae]|uniref:OmpP1/FadL family transporter n=1 Tax=Litoribrevibacter euphylliae TaxID=1834034 RepID=A0ABV7H7G3_9GAMM
MKASNRLSAFLLIALLCCPQFVVAQLGTNLTISSHARSQGNAVTANPQGVVESIHFNPAGLTKLDDRQLELSITNAFLRLSAKFNAPEDYEILGLDKDDDPVANTKSLTRQLAFYAPVIGYQSPKLPAAALPSAGISIQPPGSKFTFANGVYVPFAFGYKRGGNDPGAFQGEEVALTRATYFSPSIGYKYSDELSFGASFNMSYQSVYLQQDMRTPNILVAMADMLQDAFGCEEGGGGSDPLAPLITLCGGRVGPFRPAGELTLQLEERLSPSFNVGFLWEPTDWFAWGATYQSESKMTLSGDYVLDYTDDFAGFWQVFNSSIFGAISGAIFNLPRGVDKDQGNARMDLTYPMHFQTGIKLDLTPHHTVTFDVGYTDYEKWDAFVVQFDRSLDITGAGQILSGENVGPRSIRIPLEYRSVWSWGVGFEHRITSRLRTRLGYEPRRSSIPDDRRNILAPLGDVHMFSSGLGYSWDKDTELSFDLTFMQSKEYIPANSSDGLNELSVTNLVYNPYAGLDVETKMTLVFAGMTFRTKF